MQENNKINNKEEIALNKKSNVRKLILTHFWI